MSRPSTDPAQAKRFKDYVLQFFDALRPIILAQTGSDAEVGFARTFVYGTPASFALKTYNKQMSLVIGGKPVWHLVAQKNEQLLMQHPELLLGFDSDRIKQLTQVWMTKLTREQRESVWQWAQGMLTVAGYDVTEAFE